MGRRIAVATTVILLTAFAGFAAAAEVTYVMKNGDRHSGTLAYHKDLNLGLISGGREQTYPISEIAAIIYNGGNPSRSELSQLPTSDNPPELERHTLVMNDGRVIHGKVYHWDPDTVIFDSTSGRATYNAGDIARLYLSGPPARQVFGGSAPPPGRGLGRGRNGRGGGEPLATVRVPANTRWTDTGLFVEPGEYISFRANGTIQFGRDMTAGPDGNRELSGRPGYAIRDMPVGALIGRIGNGAPFPIGSSTTAIRMGSSGRLFLGVNDDGYEDNAGAFDVDIVRRDR